MTIEKKLLGTSPSGGATDVADVFSTHLYTGTGSAQTITNGIDLAGKGGLVWLKGRSAAHEHALIDTERGDNKAISSSSNAAEASETGFGSFLSDGFSFVNGGAWYNIQQNNQTYASWTFRKKEKFFDVVTYTGNGANRTIAHSLGGPVGFMAVKRTSALGAMTTFHKSLGGTKFMEMHSTYLQQSSINVWNNTAPTDAVFSLGVDSAVNGSGHTYVAYLWADNSAEDAEEQMIKCGSYTGTGASVGASVTLGWEPQFVLVKAATAAGSWAMMDTMRGIPNDADNPTFFADTNAAEVAQANWLEINSTGFKTLNGNYANGNASGVTYIYMAIRAPMMKEPEAATDVFDVEQGNASGSSTVMEFDSGFPVDFAITHDTSGSNHDVMTRLMGPYRLRTQLAEAQADTGVNEFDSNIGYHVGSQGPLYIANMWKRAKGFFDVVAYNGNATARVIPHSLGVVPEMIWVKKRSASKHWSVYHKDLTSTAQWLSLSLPQGDASNSNFWNNGVDHTSTTFSIHTTGYVNSAASTYIAYLFATLAGISKVGSYTGNGSSQTISCGFSAGSRYILIKRTDTTGDWYVWDSVRGIVSGNDPYLSLNTTSAQVTNDDSVDPHNSGFIVNQVSASNINVSSGTYIFYAIA